MLTSSISFGDEGDSVLDLEGPFDIRICDDDPDFPISLEGETKGGYEVNISLTKADAVRIWDFIDNSTLTT